MERTERRILQLLVGASSSPRRFESVLRRILVELTKSCNAKAAFLVRYCPSRNTCSLMAVSSAKDHSTAFPFLNGPERLIGAECEDVCQRQMKSRFRKKKIVSIRDPVSALNFLATEDERRALHSELGATSYVAVPFLSARSILGYFVIALGPDKIPAGGNEILKDVGLHVAAFLAEHEAAVRNGETSRSLRIFSSIDDRLLRHKDPEKVIQTLVARVNKLIPCHHAGILLYNSVANCLEHAYVSGDSGFAKELDNFDIPLGKGLLGLTGESKRPAIFNDAHRDHRSIYPQGVRPQVEHLIAVPLMSRERLQGVLFLTRMSEERFVESELRDATRIAEKFSLAFEQVIRLNESLHREQQLKSLQVISRQIAGSLDLRTVLDTIIKEAIKLVPHAQRGTVLIVDEEHEDMFVAASYGYSQLLQDKFRIGLNQGYAGRAYREKQGILIEDVRKENRLEVEDEFPETGEVKSAIITPLKGRRGVFGVISLDSTNSLAAFSAHDLHLLDMLASNASVAFLNARLHSSLEKEVRKIRLLKEIQELGERLGASEEFYQEVMARIMSAFEYSFVAVMIADNERRVLRAVAISGYIAPSIGPGYEQSFDVGVMGMTVRSGRLKIINDVRKEPAYISHYDQPLQSELCVPIILPTGELHGCINIESPRIGRFSKSDEDTLTSVASGIANTVHEERLRLALATSEAKYRTLVEESLVGVYVLQDGIIRYFNRRAADLFGYAPEDLVDIKPIMDLVAPESRDVVLSNVQMREQQEPRSISYTFTGLHRNGTRVFIEVFGTLSILNGRPSILGTLVDRTQEEFAMNEIREWRQRYDLIVTSSGQVAYDHSIKTGEILWSRSIEHVLGYPYAKMNGGERQWRFLIHPDDVARALTVLERAEEPVIPYDLTYRMRNSTGDYLWMHDRGFYVVESGVPVKMLGMMEDVTRQKELEQRVRSSELKHRLLFDNSQDAVLLMRGDRFIDCNSRTLEMFRVERSAIIGQTPYAFSPPHQPDGRNSREKALEKVGNAITGAPQRFQWRHIRFDGTPFEAEVILNRFDFEGEVLLQAQVRDISEQELAKAKLEQSERNYRMLVQEAGEAIFVATVEGIIVEANDKACVLFGFSREEVIGKTAWSLQPHLSDFQQQFHALYRQLLLDGSEIMFGDSFRRKDGSEFPFEAIFVLLPNGLLQAIIRDVTVQKRAEREMDFIFSIAATMRENELFDGAAAAIAELLKVPLVQICTFERDNTVVRLRAGVASGKVLHGPVEWDLLPPWQEVRETKATVIRSEEDSFMLPGPAIIPEIPVRSLMAVPMLSSNREAVGAVITASDGRRSFSEHERKIVSIISQRLASETETLQRQERERMLADQLLQAQKMESLGTLAGGVAHDFNNIIGAILGFTGLLNKEGWNAKDLHYIDGVDKAAHRASTLAAQLLGFAQRTRTKINTFHVDDVVNETFHILESTLPRSIRIRLELGDSIPPIDGDIGQVSQVVMNICLNARDAMMEHLPPEGIGSLLVRTEAVEITAEYASGRVGVAPGRYVRLTIRDSGPGIPYDIQKKIFEPFFTTKAKGKGTGLGLAVVYGIVRDHGGFIDLETAPGKGTSFHVHFPVSAEGKVTKATGLPPADRWTGKGELIMVVDDEPIMRDVCDEILQMHGYVTCLAANGEEAIELYRKQGSEIRLVLLDFILPGMNGREIFRRILEIDPKVRVLFISGSLLENEIPDLLSNGAMGLVRKPFSTHDLLKQIHEAINTPS